jgi:hypothetical protein
MPERTGTGPEGQGPMTGWGRGMVSGNTMTMAERKKNLEEELSALNEQMNK